MPSDPNVPAQNPNTRPTVAIELPPPWAIALTQKVADGFKATEEHFDKQDETLARLANESVSAASRLGRVESTIADYGSRLVVIEGRQDKTSMSVRGVSTSDEGQNMQIASLAVKVDELSGKAVETHAMLATITGLLDKPMVKRIGYAFGALLLAALTAGTGYLARGNVQPAPPTIIQVPK